MRVVFFIGERSRLTIIWTVADRHDQLAPPLPLRVGLDQAVRGPSHAQQGAFVVFCIDSKRSSCRGTQDSWWFLGTLYRTPDIAHPPALSRRSTLARMNLSKPIMPHIRIDTRVPRCRSAVPPTEPPAAGTMSLAS